MRKYCKALVNITITLLILALAVFLLPGVLVFFLPFVIGWLIAWIASPLVRFFEKKLRVKRRVGSVLVIIVILAVVVLALYGIGAKIFEEARGLWMALPAIWESAEADLAVINNSLSGLYERLPSDLQINIEDAISEIGTYLGSFFAQMGSPTIEAVGNFAKHVPTLLIGVIMTLLSAYFFVADRKSVTAWFHKHMPESLRERYLFIKKSAIQAVGGYFKAQLKIEVWMYLLLVIGLWVLKVNYALVLAIGIAFLDLLPFFGTGTVLVPWAVIKVLNGDYRMTFGLVAIWLLGQLARQLIQPKIVGDSIGLPPLPTLLLLYIGYRMGGVIGMIMAVPIGLIAVRLYEAGFFDTTKNSVQILICGINRFRRLDDDDLTIVREETVSGKGVCKEE